ncbi:hypothetical protein AABB24_031931 [Solanum stoloniferum]|uniref:Uncharacterized protein n=1 Tax=Solanum stoloniferum TaxID=62892 RepID=A0ABD2RXH6_9SOLN
MDTDRNCFASSSLCSETQRVNCSKAQNCLLKILKIISTVPPHNNNTPPSQNLNGFAVDLNIGFNLTPLEMEEESGSPVDGGFVNSSVVEECGSGGVDFGKCSDIDDGGEESCKIDTCVEILQLENNGVFETSELKEEIGEVKEQQGFMGLLIEAATLIFGDFKDENPLKLDNTTTEKLNLDEHHYNYNDNDATAAKKQLKRRVNEYTEEVIEDKSSYPLVRSKRGRIQVLPNKYRDSILEPLMPFSRIRSTIVPTNRRRSK